VPGQDTALTYGDCRRRQRNRQRDPVIARKPKGYDFDCLRKTVHGQVARHMSHTGG
jgi:hypothetical protein